MASPTGRPLSEILSSIVAINNLEYGYLMTWKTMLSGNITAADCVEMGTNLDSAMSQLASLVAEGGAGLAAYASAQYPGMSTNIANDYTATKKALQDCFNWLNQFVQSGSVKVVNLKYVGDIYVPDATSQFLTLVNAAIATFRPPV